MTEYKTNIVPCNGCTLCCENDLIVLHPECGDDPSQYEIETYGKLVVVKSDPKTGDCVYLKRGEGCSIHDNRPVVCRELDCRFVTGWDSRTLRDFVNNGLFSQDVIDRGFELFKKTATMKRNAAITSGKKRRRKAKR